MKFKHLSVEEREKLQLMHWERRSVRSMAKALNRSPSSISRELRRNFPREHKRYTPRMAEARAMEKRRSRGRKDRLKSEAIRQYVISHLKLRWSPEQISGRMKRDCIGSISHEAIYQFIYSQLYREGNGTLREGREDLRKYLRRKKKLRMRKSARRSRLWRPRGTSIEERPEMVNQKKRVGDWEGDSVESRDHKPGVNTLLERKTGFFLVTKLKNKTSIATIEAMEKRITSFPAHTLTLDNGPENTDWQTMESTLNLKVFFAHPYCSSERGANENANGLLREYFPKKTDFTQISEEEILKVEYDLNTRPRKRLGFRTPLEAMSVALRG